MASDSRCCVLDFPTIMHSTNLHQGTNYHQLKDKQKDVLSASAVGDVIGVLPTGFGKTVVIQMLPFLTPGKCIDFLVLFQALLIDSVSEIKDFQLHQLCTRSNMCASFFI